MQMRVAAKEAAALQLHSNTQVEALRASSAAAQQELAIQRARTEGLAQELTRLQSLSATLETALKNAKPAQKARAATRRKRSSDSATGRQDA